jgi:putative transposase
MKQIVIISMIRTIKLLLPKNDSLLKTLRINAQIYEQIVSIGYQNQTFNKNKLHKFTYKKIRKKYSNFPSALVQSVRDVASEALKRTKLKKKIKPRPYSSLRYDKRTIRINLRENFVTMSSVGGRQLLNFQQNKHSIKYADWNPIAATLSYKKGNLFLNIIVEKEAPSQLIANENEVLGIDLGLKNILVCSNNWFFNSKHLRKIKGKYQYLRRVLQSKGTASAKRKLKKISRRERRFVTDINHTLSKKIAESDFKIFALENLSKIRMPKKERYLGKKFNRKIGNWSFGQFGIFLAYKSEVLGKTLIQVNPRNTSRKCSRCGHIETKNRTGSTFKCIKCYFELHADLNASRNIAMLGISEYSRLQLNQPNVAAELPATSLSF